MVKTLKLTDETHSRLAKLGSVGQSFEDVIKSLLDEHDAMSEVGKELEAIRKLLDKDEVAAIKEALKKKKANPA